MVTKFKTAEHIDRSTDKSDTDIRRQYNLHSNIMEETDVQDLVKSVANKQQANKRKRDPDMYLDAVLECTVRRLNRERMEQDESVRIKRRRISPMNDEDEKATGSYSAPSEHSSEKVNSVDCSRIFTTDTINACLDENECDIMDRHLDDELSGDLKELLDELAREFPGDFWLTDANNNCQLSCETEENENDLWLSNIIEVLCSS